MPIKTKVDANRWEVQDEIRGWECDMAWHSLNDASVVCLHQVLAGSSWGAGMAWCWLHSPPPNLARVRATSGLSWLLFLSSAPNGFSPGSPVFLSPQKSTFPDSKFQFDRLQDLPENHFISILRDGVAIGHVRYINILTWLRGFRVKIANILSFFCLSIPKRDLDTKKTTLNYEVCPESLGALLEYWYIEHGLLQRNHKQRKTPTQIERILEIFSGKHEWNKWQHEKCCARWIERV